MSANDVLGLQRGNGLEDFHFFVSQRLAVHSRRRLQREIAQQLEQVVLNDVADGARGVVEPAASLDAEVLRHGDLHALDVGAIPERLEDRIREAREQHVVHGALAKVVVDPKDVPLHERAEQDPIQLARRDEVLPEGLLDDDARTFRATRLRQLFHHRSKERGRDRKVMRRVLCASELTPERLEGLRIFVVSVDIAKQSRQFGECVTIQPPPYFSTLSCARMRNWSRFQPALATPMTGTSRSPRLAIAWSEGKIFLYARSPVAPKNTSASECVSLIAVPVLTR